jgi:uncharacterized integral membrane protein
MTDESHDPFGLEPKQSPRPKDQQADSEERSVEPSAGVAWGAILFLVGVALVVVFAVQNTETVPVEFLWMEGRFSLAIVILVTAGVAVVLSELFGIGYRRRRRLLRAEREELRKFRRDS